MGISLVDAERAVYLQQHGWNWDVPKRIQKQKLFGDDSLQLFRPTIRREV